MRRKEATYKATENEYDGYRSLGGSTIWAGNGGLPQASLVASFKPHTAPKLRFQEIIEANKLLSNLNTCNQVSNLKICTSTGRSRDPDVF